MSYLDNFQRYGIVNFINKCFSKLGIKISLNDAIQKKRIYLSKRINELCNGEVIDGLYKGTKFIYSSDYFTSKPAQLLGCYEKEVQQKIYELSNKHSLKHLISVGAGEGYHVVGSKVAKLFKHFISFELEQKNMKIIKKNFELNNVFEGFEVFQKADIDFINSIKDRIDSSKSLFLIDIEGDEFLILNDNNLKMIKNSCLIIEFHHFYLKSNQQEQLITNLEKYFNVSYIKTGSRKFSDFEILNKFNDDEKWLMMSESRPSTMKWIICEPNNN